MSFCLDRYEFSVYPFPWLSLGCKQVHIQTLKRLISTVLRSLINNGFQASWFNYEVDINDGNTNPSGDHR